MDKNIKKELTGYYSGMQDFRDGDEVNMAAIVWKNLLMISRIRTYVAQFGTKTYADSIIGLMNTVHPKLKPGYRNRMEEEVKKHPNYKQYIANLEKSQGVTIRGMKKAKPYWDRVNLQTSSFELEFWDIRYRKLLEEMQEVGLGFSQAAMDQD